MMRRASLGLAMPIRGLEDVAGVALLCTGLSAAEGRGEASMAAGNRPEARLATWGETAPTTGTPARRDGDCHQAGTGGVGLKLLSGMGDQRREEEGCREANHRGH